jgi:hypothetical protein
MGRSVTVSELFRAARLKRLTVVSWDEIPSIKEKSCGVYVIALTKNPTASFGESNIRLEKAEQERWLHFQPVIYIGKTDSTISERLKAFFRHKYGKTSPHRGGQSRHLVRHIPQWVFFAHTKNPARVERVLIDYFLKRTGKLPFANRRR